MLETKGYSVAIDGPAGAGKSSLARRVARELGFLYVDTGAIYRAVGYHLSLMGIGPRDVDGITRLLDDINLEIAYSADGTQRMLLNGADVTEEIRTPEVSKLASQISVHSVVRDFLLELQRDLARRHSVIMDGRDIGTVVLPQADVKIYLTASIEERARRRLQDLHDKGIEMGLKEVMLEIQERDRQDMNRPVAPLRQAKDAVFLDTSSMTLEQAAQALKKIILERIPV